MRAICTDTPPTKMIKPCDICGDVGVSEAIITCCRCKSTREHLYCMRVVRIDVPQFWDCDECLGNKLVSPTNCIKQTPNASEKRVPTFMQKSPTLNEGPNKNDLPNRFNFKEKGVDTGRTKYLSCDEVAKLSSGANKLKCSPRKGIRSSRVIPRSMPPPRERTPVKSQQIERGSKSDTDLQKPVGKRSTGPKVTFCEFPKISKRIETTSTEREPKKVNFEVPSPITVETDAAMDVEVAKSSEVLVKTVIQSRVISTEREPKGSFTLPHGHGNFNNTIFLAHPPSKVHIKVYETLVKMPKKLCFELAPNHEIYRELFSDSLPDKDDIGLYFFPSESSTHRSEESMTLTDFLGSKNLLMHSLVNGVELLVFSSKLLKPCLQEFQGKCFLWGVFRCRKNSKPVIEAPRLLEDKRERCYDTPPGCKSVAKAPLLTKVKDEPCVDAPPGFKSVAGAPVKGELSLDPPPGFERISKPKS